MEKDMARDVRKSDRDERRSGVDDERRKSRRHVKGDLLHLRRGLVGRVSHASALGDGDVSSRPRVRAIVDGAIVVSRAAQSLWWK